MREILFRGKRFDTGEWLYGYFVQMKNNIGGIHSCIFQNFEDENRWEMKRVLIRTVCQYTGLKDRDGKKIFENDILNVTYSDEQGECHHTENYVLKDMRNTSIIGWLDYANELEIVGNAFDNPELL